MGSTGSLLASSSVWIKLSNSIGTGGFIRRLQFRSAQGFAPFVESFVPGAHKRVAPSQQGAPLRFDFCAAGDFSTLKAEHLAEAVCPEFVFRYEIQHLCFECIQLRF